MAKTRKTEIMKAAQKRFIRHGLHKTTLEEVARDLRIGKATIYHYFPSKDELFNQTVLLEIDEFVTTIKNYFNNEEVEMKQRFQEYFLFKMKLGETYPLLFEVVKQSLCEFTNEKFVQLHLTFLQKEEEVLRLVLQSLNKETYSFIDSQFTRLLISQTTGTLLLYQMQRTQNFLDAAFLEKAKEEFLRTFAFKD